MRQVAVSVYKWEDLTDEQKDRIVDKLYDINVHDDWWDACYEDFTQVAEILGIALKQRPVKLMGGQTRYDPAIYFSGFSSQGDGACFEGTYRYNKGASKAIRAYAPQDKDLHEIADGLRDIQKPWFYRLGADVVQRGHYVHKFSTDIDVYDRENRYREITASTEDGVKELLRDFMQWMYRQLEKEYGYLTSREAIVETIEANEYEFTEDGSIY